MCQSKEWWSSSFILNNKNEELFIFFKTIIMANYGWKWSLSLFYMQQWPLIYVLAASNGGIKLVEARTVHFTNCRSGVEHAYLGLKPEESDLTNEWKRQTSQAGEFLPVSPGLCNLLHSNFKSESKSDAICVPRCHLFMKMFTVGLYMGLR